MSHSPRIVFAGTPDFAVPPLQALIDAGHAPCAVYTQPDRPAGRGRRLRPSPVKRRALDHELPVCQPQSLRDPEAREALAALQPELMIVVAYGLILPQAVLDMPRLGCINIHASLLPRWRGAAPIQRAMLAGDAETGVCLMQMERGLDTGPVLARAATPIHAEDTGGTLHDRLSLIGASLLAGSLEDLLAGRLSAEPQDEALACYADKLQKSEARIDWSDGAAAIQRRIAAFNPWPVAETRHGGSRLRLWRAEVAAGESAARPPGTVLKASADGVLVSCGAGLLRLQELQPEGGRAMAAGDFLNGHPLRPGNRFH
ncbi:methionyl-tRNA formyltransferase [Methylonatrum kenyense]|uniref:methionyl-tRNA formyltransferase n=1 Tax=Methylonatrum kenyense TaxID=455253 RepID=UPI0020C04064|nr:methionyl-tRNA formyltransferase [Methylonatrum kenyense]MCK8515317.1 methionyl-tRNA formyltransferase [Methylonatrum kenyense]